MYFFFVIATVGDTDYLTKVKAETASAAEHTILDLGVCGKHTYGVTACTAYAGIEMKLDTFIGHALNAIPVSFNELRQIINKRNFEIREKDAAEIRIAKIKEQMEDLQKALDYAKAILNK